MAKMNVAVSEKTFAVLFKALRDNFLVEKAGVETFEGFTAGYDLRVRLAEGTVDLRADNTVQIKELDIKWERLILTLRVDVPPACVGGFCIVPNPLGGCLLQAPTTCLFTGNADIDITLDLGSHLRTEVSVTGSLAPRLFQNSDRPADMDPWEAREATPSLADQWRIFLDPQFIDVDVIDVADSAGDLLEQKLNAAVTRLTSTVSTTVPLLITTLVGPAVQFVRDALDLPDELQEWISDLLNVSFGIHDFLLQLLADYFAAENPLTQIETPYPVFPPAAATDRLPELLPVMVPIDDLKVSNDADEMILEADLGVL